MASSRELRALYTARECAQAGCYPRRMALLLGAGAVLLAAFVKGAIGFGFPTLGTPLLSLVVEVKSAVVVLIVPNIVLDGLQFLRRGAPLACRCNC